MARIAEEILATESEHPLGVQAIPEIDRERIRERVFRLYTGGRTNRIWENLHDCDSSIQDSNAWSWIGDFVRERNCVLFFDLADEVEMFHVPSGPSLDVLLGDTYGFVFYVTDVEASYLIGFNDHDFLICCGDAQEWLEVRLARSSAQSPPDVDGASN